MEKLSGLFEFLKAVDPSAHTNLCKDLTSKLSTCINAIAPVLFETLEAHSDGCCRPMFDQAVKNTVEDPATLVRAVMGLLLDSICATSSLGVATQDNSTRGCNMAQFFLKTI